MLKERFPLLSVVRSFTVVTGGNAHFPEDTRTRASSFLIVFAPDFAVGITKETRVSDTPASQTEGYFTTNPSYSFLYSESLSFIFVVSLTDAPPVGFVVLRDASLLLFPKDQTITPKIISTATIIMGFFMLF